ncbi:MAG TPA: hypothetical protein VMZ90_06705 [Vicinamibacterales bacterium]|nr:hypothetical protein [Vicinamibacterales bacterium]
MTRMRVPAHVTGLLLVGGLAAGCSAHAEPLTPSASPALNVPEPPGRYVLPATEQQTLPPPIEEASSTSAAPPTSRPPVRTPNPRPAAPPQAEPPPPAPAPTPTPAILLTSANSPAFEKSVQEQLKRARTDLGQVTRATLGTDARAQFDAAQGFIRQADEALKVKNLIYAGQLADKAATMAALLKKK